MNPPTGTVTFLFTDIEGSTKLWEAHPDAMRKALATHDALLKRAIGDNGGFVFKTVGDAFCAAFAAPSAAVAAALEAQLALQAEDWGETGSLRTRMGLHTGEVEERDNDYFGPTLNRVARLHGIAYGQQTLLSQATYQLVRDSLPAQSTIKPLGTHRLKDLQRPEQVFALIHPDLPSEFPPLKSLDNPALPNNLPQQVTSFVGREREIGEVKALLEKSRLLTLLGIGGTGKTRLSLQVAAEQLDSFADGVWFIELAAITDVTLVPQTVANVLRIREEAGKPLLQTLMESLKEKQILLVFDNCEHLLNSCACLADALIKSCPHVQILASSREALNISGEQVYHLAALSVPSSPLKATPASLNQYEAVRLFIERAIAVQSTFAVTNANAPDIAQLCVRLDGIPLAIELAAARVTSLSAAEIGARLDKRFRLLTGGSRMALPRQQTLRALVDWSYDLLNGQEKTLLCRLSVFSGGWTLQAAERVCAKDEIEDWEILDLQAGLIDKSLIVAEAQDVSTRYRLLETIRAYGADRLQEGGHAAELASRHHAYFHGVAREASAELSGPGQQAALDRMNADHDNLRAALQWAIGNSGPSALEMAVAMGEFWYVAGALKEGRELLGQALATDAGASPELEANALYQDARLATEQGDFATASARSRRSLELSREVGDRRCAAAALNNLAIIAYQRDEYSTAQQLFEESLTLRRALDDKAGVANTLGNLGVIAEAQGRYEEAHGLYAEAQALFRVLGNRRGIARALSNQAAAYFNDGDVAEARKLTHQSLEIARDLKDDWYAAYALLPQALIAKHENRYAHARALAQECLDIVRKVGDRPCEAALLALLGEVACAEGDRPLAAELLTASLRLRVLLGQRLEMSESLSAFAALALAGVDSEAQQAEAARQHALRATRLLGAAGGLSAALGAPLPPISRADREARIEAIKQILDPQAFEAAWAEGQAMTREQATAYALAEQPEVSLT